MMEVHPRYPNTALTAKVRQSAFEQAIDLPEGLALLYWDRAGQCRTFSLMSDNLHFTTPVLDGVYHHRSEIITV